MYIEDWEKLNIKNKSQLSCTMFFAKYVILDLCDEDLKKRIIIGHEHLEFIKNAGWNLIGIPEKPDGTLSDHEYFCIHDDLFDKIKSTHQDRNIMWKFIYQMNQIKINLRVKQERNTMKGSKIRRGVLPKNEPIIIFIEGGKNS